MLVQPSGRLTEPGPPPVTTNSDVLDGERPSPLAPDIGIVGLVPNEWSAYWQPRHQVMRRLARYFNVAWLNPAPEWRRSLRRRRPTSHDTEGPGWTVIDPPWYLPKLYRPRALAELIERGRLGRARRVLADRGARRLVLYLWRPQFAHHLDRPHDASIYHLDDEYFDADRDAVDPAEEALLRRVDQVIIHSPGLLERKGHYNPHTATVPNGVDFATFARPRPIPADLAAVPVPRIGYIGWIKPVLDWALLDRLAAQLPACAFVFVGPIKHPETLEVDPAFRALRARRNVHFLGPKSLADLGAYPQHFDVGMMPYRVTAYTDNIYPLKLHEYFAAGCPAIGTPIRALREHAELMSIADAADGWRAAIEQVLAAPRDLGRTERQTVARDHDWNILVARIAKLIGERLDHPVARSIDPQAERPG
ncbi:MAG: glycosyltransferase [Gemmatimonadales bacterium]